jgi:hypothetical protein
MQHAAVVASGHRHRKVPRLHEPLQHWLFALHSMVGA